MPSQNKNAHCQLGIGNGLVYIPTHSDRRSALILGIFEFPLQLPDFPLHASLSGFDASLALQALAASHAASSFLDSPLGFFESAFGSILRASFHTAQSNLPRASP
jgi:hypothetical protein